MARIVGFNNDSVTLELKSGKQKEYDISLLNYDNAEIGDEVGLYKDEDGEMFIDLKGEPEPVESKPRPRQYTDHPNPAQQSSGLAVAGLVLGIVGIALSFVPILNNAAFIMGIIAVVFAMISLIRKRGKGKSIAALILGVLAIAITLVLQDTWTKSINNAAASFSAEAGNITGENTDQILGTDVDVQIGTFTESKDQYGYVTSDMTITVKNLTSESKSFSIHLEAVDGNGNRIDDDYVYANNLGAGQSQDFKAFQYVSSDNYDAMNTATFNIVEVSMY